MVKVRLKGLKIARARGRYYVYVRATGEALLQGFEGSKADLEKRLADPDLIGAYNTRRKRQSYSDKTLGWLVAWYQSDDCPEYQALKPASRADYDAALAWLYPEYDAALDTINQAALYEVRDRCAREKWPAFADKVITALSSMFTAAAKRGKMLGNPAAGIGKVRKTNKNANREWRPDEWQTVMERAPLPLKTAYMIARYLGYRSQSTVAVKWTNYQPDELYGMCFRMAHNKNDEPHWLPAPLELQEYLFGLKVRTPDGHIALRAHGQPWESPEQLQKQSSNFLTTLARKGLVGAGLTEHGLRATFAAARKRERRASDSEVAAALGDRDTRMGAHYTRHVENEFKVIQAFGKPNRNRTRFGKREGADFPNPTKCK